MTSQSDSMRHGRETGGEARNEPHRGPSHEQAASPWEWVAAAVGVVLVLGAIGYMAYHGMTSTAPVPDVTVQTVAVEQSGNGHVVRFLAKNHSNATAATLLVEGELREGGTVVETAETTIDFLPPYSERHAGLFFENDPGRYELTIQPKGYDEP